MPHKHFYKIGGRRIFEIIDDQLCAIFGSENIVYCLPDTKANDMLENALKARGRAVARGSETDVLRRLQQATSRSSTHAWIARINGDNLIILRDVMARAVEATQRSDIDLITNVRPRHFPKGCSIEIVRREIFVAPADSVSDYEREHVFPYFYESVPAGRIFNLEGDSNHSHLDFACDDFRQFKLLEALIGDRTDWQSSDLPLLSRRAREFAEANPFVGRSGVYTIAEVGGNHEGDFGYAKRLVESACNTDVDAIKLQIYSPDLLVNPKVDPNRHAHFGRFALSPAQYDELLDIIRTSGKHVSASVWSVSELMRYVDQLDFLKVGSGDLTDAIMLEAIRNTGKPVIVSSGLATMDEITWALERLDQASRPSRVGVLQCTSMYPIPDFDSNLAVIGELRKQFDCLVGYSDHTEGSKALELAVAAGATIQEFHFTDTRKGKTFRDHFVSLTPAETQALIAANIRATTLIGSSVKSVTMSEELAGHSQSFRKGTYLNRNVRNGEVIKADDLITLRPVAGIPAADAFRLVGARASRDISRLSVLDFSDFSFPEAEA